jgi:lysozyme family protein
MWPTIFSLTYNVLKTVAQWQMKRNLSDSDFLNFIEAHQKQASALGDLADEAAQALDDIQLELPLGNKGLKTNHCSRPLGYYQDLYLTMKILPQYQGTVDWYAQRALKQKSLYTRASAYVENLIKLKVPWQVIATIHAMEASFDPSRQLLNGEKWNKKTTIVPKDKGPWSSFEASCVDAFRESHWKGVDFTSIESLLRASERYNGIGYQKRCKASPYLWSFSNHGLGTGKYIADGKYSPTAVSKQAGVAVILKALGYV